MPRSVAFSAKQKRAQLKDKRAVKRGELDPSDVRISQHISGDSTDRYIRKGGTINRVSRRVNNANGAMAGAGQGISTGRLISKFIALTPAYVQETSLEAYTLEIPRPIPEENKVFPVEVMARDSCKGKERETDARHGKNTSPRLDVMAGRLTCPVRPKFRYDMTKKEVERNEEGYYVRWLKSTQDIVHRWVDGADEVEQYEAAEGEDDEEVGSSASRAKGLDRRTPTWFETNLEVWRQLWRVTEVSHVLLVLLDARCPPLHLPHSLRYYLQTMRPRKEVILVLTKSDLVDPVALAGWKEWIKGYWQEGLDELEDARRARSGDKKANDGEQDKEGENGVQVVSVRSYDTDLLYADKVRHRPDLPSSDLTDLVKALESAHTRLCTPHSRIAADIDRLAGWKPTVRSRVDWDLLAQGPGAAYPPVGSTVPAQVASAEDGIDTEESEEDAPVPSNSGSDGQTRQSRDVESEPLTMGLIGQPNVGKSSLLNALMGEQKVKASKTPGKTKHFQTMFWGWKREVKIVDCPGLVCPSLVGLEIQALCGILPISQIPSLPACITTAAHLLPLETIFRIPKPPPIQTDEYAHKKTYRDGMTRVTKNQGDKWTAGMILEGRALDRGYITAKSARPDVNRAGNGMMRALAEGKIRWGFYPPSLAVAVTGDTETRAEVKKAEGEGAEGDKEETGRGIWLGDFEKEEAEAGNSDESGVESAEERHGVTDVPIQFADSSEEDSEDDGEIEEMERKAKEIDRGFFAALDMDREDESESE